MEHACTLIRPHDGRVSTEADRITEISKHNRIAWYQDLLLGPGRSIAMIDICASFCVGLVPRRPNNCIVPIDRYGGAEVILRAWRGYGEHLSLLRPAHSGFEKDVSLSGAQERRRARLTGTHDRVVATHSNGLAKFRCIVRHELDLCCHTFLPQSRLGKFSHRLAALQLLAFLTTHRVWSRAENAQRPTVVVKGCCRVTQ